jgi:hypothetical protein
MAGALEKEQGEERGIDQRRTSGGDMRTER